MATIDPRITELRQRTERRTVAASAEGAAAAAGMLSVGALGLAWIATYAAGGSKTALPHAFYVPVILCAIRFGHRGALLVSVAAGVVAGPLTPLDVQAGTSQQVDNWVARIVAFVVIGQLTAYLSRHSLPSLTNELAGHRFRHQFREAISNGQIRLEYQPIVDLATGDLAGVEALARWDHPEYGAIPPDEFIKEAERRQCISELTRHLIAQACGEVAEWRNSLLRDQPLFKLAVNVSAADISDPELCDHVSAVLDDTGLPNHWLYLEITETALVDDIDAVVERLMDLRMVGIRLAIDDFGTGESSLAHLQQYPIDVLKIDRAFVNRVDTQPPTDVLAHGIIALAQAMDLRTVAEGIETGGQARVVRDLGCTMGQGYLFSRPLDVAAIEAILKNPRMFRYRNLSHLEPPSSSEGIQQRLV
jgi:EAL domain-containing protein (putative c-di-GMP-specific phosphodiesterase class I)